MFKIKTYSKSATHSIYLIDEIINNELRLRHDRIKVDNEIEEDE